MRIAAIALTVAAAAADSSGSHAAAYYLLLGAVPVTTVAALAALGDLVEAGLPVRPLSLTQTIISLCIAGLIVVTTAARSGGLLSGHVPRVAFSALVGSLLLYVLQGALAGLAEVRHRSQPRRHSLPQADRPLSRAA